MVETKNNHFQKTHAHQFHMFQVFLEWTHNHILQRNVDPNIHKNQLQKIIGANHLSSWHPYPGRRRRKQEKQENWKFFWIVVSDMKKKKKSLKKYICPLPLPPVQMSSLKCSLVHSHLFLRCNTLKFKGMSKMCYWIHNTWSILWINFGNTTCVSNMWYLRALKKQQIKKEIEKNILD